ncbi:MAG: hypothetical protein ACI9N9_000091 [Enterobacterales bacterium]|jgi:hypothetical protein
MKDLNAQDQGYIISLIESDISTIHSSIRHKSQLMDDYKDKPLIASKYTHESFIVDNERNRLRIEYLRGLVNTITGK